VTPVITGYEGVVHCFRTTIEEEGFSGLYKGFGALVLQYGLQILLIRLVKIVLEKNPFGTSIATPPAHPERSVSSIHPIGIAQPEVRRIETPVASGNVRPASRQYSRYTNLIYSIFKLLKFSFFRSFTPTTMQGDAAGDEATFEPRYRSRFSNYSPDK